MMATFELTFTVRYEVTEDQLLTEYEVVDGDFEKALSGDAKVFYDMPGMFIDAIQRDGDVYNVTGKIVEENPMATAPKTKVELKVTHENGTVQEYTGTGRSVTHAYEAEHLMETILYWGADLEITVTIPQPTEVGYQYAAKDGSIWVLTAAGHSNPWMCIQAGTDENSYVSCWDNWEVISFL